MNSYSSTPVLPDRVITDNHPAPRILPSARASWPPGLRPGNTAEPSGELSVGDVVAVGEAGLAVARAGWTLVRGGPNEVRTDEHGTHPLPPDAQRGTGRLPSQEGQDDATRD
jgi:hypothetical protein